MSAIGCAFGDLPWPDPSGKCSMAPILTNDNFSSESKDLQQNVTTPV